MARLVAQIKGGYYAASPVAVAAVLERLRRPTSGECVVLDPCAGEGHALLQLAQALRATAYGNVVWADQGEHAVVGEQMGGTFDELRFHPAFAAGSVVVGRIAPDERERAVADRTPQEIGRGQRLAFGQCLLDDRSPVFRKLDADAYETSRFFEENFSQISAMPFPEEVRKFGETVILGCKRKQPRVVNYSDCPYDWLEQRMEQHVVYTLPAGVRPKHFRKTEPTDTELARLVAKSPLRFHIERPADRLDYRPRPPLSPGNGHRAMLLASGHIDGLICPPGEPPHVIRGTAAKDEYVASCDDSVDDAGNVTTRTVISEKPRLVIRVLDSHGNIVNLES